MASNRDKNGYLINPDYGSGCFRRRIKISQMGEVVRGEMEDNHHGFCVTVTLKEGKVYSIVPEYKRFPFNTCPGSDQALNNLLGVDAGLDLKTLNSAAVAHSNCTHLLDLTILCIQHSRQVQALRVFDIEVQDEAAGVMACRVWCNQELLHHWETTTTVISYPDTWKNVPLRKGFAKWANRQFTGVHLQAAFMIQKSHFVSQGRRIHIDEMAGECAYAHKTMLGACHTYSEETAQKAFRLPKTTRNFTDCPEQLLTFR